MVLLHLNFPVLSHGTKIAPFTHIQHDVLLSISLLNLYNHDTNTCSTAKKKKREENDCCFATHQRMKTSARCKCTIKNYACKLNGFEM